jgi:hypothetical protein
MMFPSLPVTVSELRRYRQDGVVGTRPLSPGEFAVSREPNVQSSVLFKLGSGEEAMWLALAAIALAAAIGFTVLSISIQEFEH